MSLHGARRRTGGCKRRYTTVDGRHASRQDPACGAGAWVCDCVCACARAARAHACVDGQNEMTSCGDLSVGTALVKRVNLDCQRAGGVQRASARAEIIVPYDRNG